jgi:hypothetical protein
VAPCLHKQCQDDEPGGLSQPYDDRTWGRVNRQAGTTGGDGPGGAERDDDERAGAGAARACGRVRRAARATGGGGAGGSGRGGDERAGAGVVGSGRGEVLGAKADLRHEASPRPALVRGHEQKLLPPRQVRVHGLPRVPRGSYRQHRQGAMLPNEAREEAARELRRPSHEPCLRPLHTTRPDLPLTLRPIDRQPRTSAPLVRGATVRTSGNERQEGRFLSGFLSCTCALEANTLKGTMQWFGLFFFFFFFFLRGIAFLIFFNGRGEKKKKRGGLGLAEGG